MAHAARTSASWICALVVVAITSSCITWLSIPRVKMANSEKPRGDINGSFMDKLLSDCQNVSRKAHGLFKVDNPKNDSLARLEEANTSQQGEDLEQNRLTWSEEFHNINLSLDSSNKWIIVKEKGVYLVYLQVTYNLKPVSNGSVHLELVVDFSWKNGTQEFLAAYDTRNHTNKDEDTLLSTFFLLHMSASDRLAIRASPKDKIEYVDTRPITSYLTIVRYSDW